MNEMIKRQLQTREGLIEFAEATRLFYQCLVYSKERKYLALFEHDFVQLLKMVDEGKYGFEQDVLNFEIEQILTFEDWEDVQLLKLISEISNLKKAIGNFDRSTNPSLLDQLVSLQDGSKFIEMVTRMSDRSIEDRNYLIGLAQSDELVFLNFDEIEKILINENLSHQFKVTLLLNWLSDPKNADYGCQIRESYFEKDKELWMPLLNYLYDLSGSVSDQIQKTYDLRTIVEKNLVNLNDYSDDSESIFEKYYWYSLFVYEQNYSRNRKLFTGPLPTVLSTGNGIRMGDEKIVIESLMKKGRTKEICEFFLLDQYCHFTFDTADFLFEQLRATYCDHRSCSEKVFLSTLIEQWIELEERPDENQSLLYLIEKSCENSPLYGSRQKLHDTLQTIVEPLNSVVIGSYYSGQNKDAESKKTYVKRAGNGPYSGR